MIDNTMFYEEQDIQDCQQAQVAACRAFYTEFQPLTVVEYDEFDSRDRTEIVVNNGNLKDLAKFLRDGKTWLAFKPAIVEDERGLVVVF